jgi:hypothetical protein
MSTMVINGVSPCHRRFPRRCLKVISPSLDYSVDCLYQALEGDSRLGW